jgi:hypothetical protein
VSSRKVTFHGQLLHRAENYEPMSGRSGTRLEIKLGAFGTEDVAGSVKGRISILLESLGLANFEPGQPLVITVEESRPEATFIPEHACGPTLKKERKK